MSNIYALQDHRWNNAGSTFNGISLNIDNGAGGAAVGAAASRIFKLTNNNVLVFDVAPTGIFTAQSTSGGAIYQGVFSSNTNAVGDTAGFKLSLPVAGWEIRFRTANVQGWFEMTDNSDQVHFRLNSYDVMLANVGILGWASEAPLTTSGVGARDVALQRDAANILALRNGTNAQVYRVYNTFTSSANFEAGVMDWAAEANVLHVGTKFAAPGVGRNMRLFFGDAITGFTIKLITGGAANISFQNNSVEAASIQAGGGANSTDLSFLAGVAGQLNFKAGGANRFFVDSSGNLNAGADNTYDIGVSASTSRFRNFFQSGFHNLGVLTFASISGSLAQVEGMLVGCNNAVTATAGVTVATSGTAHALLYYDGTQWKACN